MLMTGFGSRASLAGRGQRFARGCKTGFLLMQRSLDFTLLSCRPIRRFSRFSTFYI